MSYRGLHRRRPFFCIHLYKGWRLKVPIYKPRTINVAPYSSRKDRKVEAWSHATGNLWGKRITMARISTILWKKIRWSCIFKCHSRDHIPMHRSLHKHWTNVTKILESKRFKAITKGFLYEINVHGKKTMRKSISLYKKEAEKRLLFYWTEMVNSTFFMIFPFMKMDATGNLNEWT